MRVSMRGAQVLAAALLLWPSAARANELLVMPYVCTMAAGQPVLTPGPEQGHRIIGQRDQRRFSSCSPVNPGMCRNWTVHRFDLDCDGTRVPWVSVVAASNEGSRRAWLLDGRLVMRMGPQWSLPPDDPCARQPDQDDRSGSRRMRRYCADVLATAPPPVVELPFGYAPMLGIDGIFVKAAPGFNGAQPSLPPVSAAPPAPSAGAGPLAELFPGSQPRPEPQRPEFQRPGSPRAELPAAEPQESLPPARPVTPPPPEPAAPPQARIAAAPPPVPAAPLPEAPRTAQPEVKAEANSEARPAAPTPNLGPRVVTISPSAPNAGQPSSPGTAGPTAPAGTTAKPAATTAPAAPGTSGAHASPGQQAQDNAASVGVFSVFRTTTTGVIVAFAGLALGLLTAFAVARRREHLNDTGKPPRDLAAVSLEGKRTRPRPGTGRGPLSPRPAAPSGTASAGRMPDPAAPMGTVAQWGDRMPRSRAEALQVLGIGVAPTASDAALKKIVDGLRQSWHPDLAADEADRALRELRSKQINAAWDLLRQRAEV